ncbi:CHAT domain-containing protein, partial [bacterium]|nr:CHAT domain-containing protein [bacterium]
ERSKSRAFLDLLAATEIKPAVELTSELRSLIEHEERCLAKVREIQTRHLRQTKVSVEPGEVERIREQLAEIWSKIEKCDPEYAFLRHGKPLSLDGLREMLHSCGKNVVLIEYFITKDETLIFVVSSKDKELHIESVPISEQNLNRYVEVYEKEVVDYRGGIGDAWLSISSYLIEPISKYLAEGDLIYFVPYGPLHYIPMHALELNGEPLIRSHPVAYSPSASLIKFCKSKGSGKIESCASFGVAFEKNEEAKFEKKIKKLNKEEKEEVEKEFKKIKALFEGESKNIAKFFSTKDYTGHLTTKDKTRENCIDKDIIHFSCHGYFDNLDPLSSGVKLYDGVLTAREIFDMRLNTELVTLSACQTGLNKRSPGDELIGLTRAFLYAGAPSVIVSLWSVDASSTQELMFEFYKLLKKDSDKATALQEAQKKIMEQEAGKYSHPYYWAPFVLVGDWE